MIRIPAVRRSIGGFLMTNRCEHCEYYSETFFSGGVLARCCYLPPTVKGFPRVSSGDGCAFFETTTKETEKAIDLSKAVLINYMNLEGTFHLHQIVPIRIEYTTHYGEPQWILVAFDLDKQDERRFALRSVNSWRFLPVVTKDDQ